jgi:AraC-like DNA-binding protein
LDAALAAASAGVGADQRYDLLLTIVAGLLADRELVRVAQVARRFDVPERTLQRMFLRYVGVPPKWLISRYRLHDAITSIDEGYTGSLAELAASLGWYDQAHFNREFVALTGTSPGDYRSRAR